MKIHAEFREKKMSSNKDNNNINRCDESANLK